MYTQFTVWGHAISLPSFIAYVFIIIINTVQTLFLKTTND